MIDGELRDVGGRVRGRLDPEAVKGAPAVFFGASGERLVAVTADGTILILAPRD